MKRLHESLTAKYNWYASWHASDLTAVLSWSLFICTGIWAANFLVAEIHSVAYLEAEWQMAALPQAAANARVGNETAELARARALTTKVLQLAADRSPRAEAELATVIAERRNLLVQLAKTDPQAIRGLLFDEAGRAALPATVRDRVEQPFKKQGRYQVYIVTTEYEVVESDSSHAHEHPTDGEGEVYFKEDGYEEYYLEVSDTERYQLLIDPLTAYDVPSDTEITITGVDVGDNLVVPTEPLSLDEWDGEPEVLAASTVRKVAVVAFKFRNTAVTPSLTTAEIKKRVFTNSNSVAAYFNQVSYGRLSLQGKTAVDGDVFGWVTIPYDAAGTCSYSTWGVAAVEELKKQGINMDGYNNIQFVFPGTDTGCGWAGLANISSLTSTGLARSWVKSGNMNTYVSGHEFGHNFGFHHAGKYNCSVAVNVSPSTCRSSEYGDIYDIMGRSAKHTNGFNKVKSGWTESNQLVTVSGSGTYTIEPVELTSTGIKYLRIKRPFTSTLGSYSNGYYLIEKRARHGTFGNYASTDPALTGVDIRLTNDSTFTGASKTFFVRTLQPGESLVDDEAGITISALTVATNSASVRIDKVTAPCVAKAPTVKVSPVSAWVPAGSLAAYSVSIINNDSENCSPSSFTVDTTLPSGFTQTPQPLTISSVNPLASKSGSVSILSPLTAAVASYPIPVRVTRSGTSDVVQQTISYNIVPADTVPPVITFTSPSDGTTLPSSGRTILPVEVQATDPSGLASIDIKINGKSVKTCQSATSCSYSWNYRKAAKGTHVIEAVATDASTNRNQATKQVTVTR